MVSIDYDYILQCIQNYPVTWSDDKSNYFKKELDKLIKGIKISRYNSNRLQLKNKLLEILNSDLTGVSFHILYVHYNYSLISYLLSNIYKKKIIKILLKNNRILSFDNYDKFLNKRYILKYSKKYNIKVRVHYFCPNNIFYKYVKKYNITLHVNISNNMINRINKIVKYKNKINLYVSGCYLSEKELIIIKVLYDNGYNIINNKILISCCLLQNSVEWLNYLIQRRCKLKTKHITGYIYNNYFNKTNALSCLKMLIEYVKPDASYLLKYAITHKKNINVITMIHNTSAEQTKKIEIDEKTLNLSLYNIDVFKFLYPNFNKDLTIYNFKLLKKSKDVLYIVKNYKVELYTLLKGIKNLSRSEYDKVMYELHKLNII